MASLPFFISLTFNNANWSGSFARPRGSKAPPGWSLSKSWEIHPIVRCKMKFCILNCIIDIKQSFLKRKIVQSKLLQAALWRALNDILIQGEIYWWICNTLLLQQEWLQQSQQLPGLQECLHRSSSKCCHLTGELQSVGHWLSNSSDKQKYLDKWPAIATCWSTNVYTQYFSHMIYFTFWLHTNQQNTLNQTASGPQTAPDLLNASGSTNPAAPSMAHRAWISSYAWYLQQPSARMWANSTYYITQKLEYFTDKWLRTEDSLRILTCQSQMASCLGRRDQNHNCTQKGREMVTSTLHCRRSVNCTKKKCNIALAKK